MNMNFEVGKIILVEEANPPKVEVMVLFREDKPFCAQSGNLTVYLDYQDYTISQLKEEAIKAAKELLKVASGSE